MKNYNKKKKIQRYRMSALEKRKALILISLGKKPNEVLKMLHKLKKEYYRNEPDLQKFGFGNDLSNIDIDFELSILDVDDLNL